MGCKKHDGHTGGCVCDAVQSIKEAQDKVEKGATCKNSCYDNLLSPKRHRSKSDTIPFMLQNKNGNYFHSVGGVGTDHCFQTVFFRVEKIDEKSCCATLSLLRPDTDIEFDGCCVDPTSICAVDDLERTGYCIEVDLDCFCAIQCLDPALVGGKDHHHHGCCK